MRDGAKRKRCRIKWADGVLRDFCSFWNGERCDGLGKGVEIERISSIQAFDGNAGRNPRALFRLARIARCDGDPAWISVASHSDGLSCAGQRQPDGGARCSDATKAGFAGYGTTSVRDELCEMLGHATMPAAAVHSPATYKAI